MAYDNTNTGTLGKNKRKETEKHPDYAGKCDIGGKPYWISGWIRTSSDGEKFFSLSFRPKDDEVKVAPTRRQSAESDIPF